MPRTSIFTNQIPALTNNQENIYTLGTVFKSSVAGKVAGIRAYIAVPPTGTTSGILYRRTSDTTGVELARKAMTITTGNSWASVVFDTPVDVDAETYYVAAWGPTNNYSATGAFFLTNPLTNGVLTAPATSVVKNGKFLVGSTIAFPSGDFNGNCYFVDVLFDTPDDESYLSSRFFIR